MMAPRTPAGAPGDGRTSRHRPPAGSAEAQNERERRAADPGSVPTGAEQEPREPAGAGPEPAEAEGARLERDLEELLQQTRSERDEYLELAQRTQADFENYRRRVARQSEEAERRGRAKLAGELIGVLDNLERALRAAGIDPAEEAEGGGEEDGALVRGVLLTYRELEGVLNRAGVEAYDPVGERFDPNWHEALQTRAEEDTDSGMVLEVVEKGYRLDGQVLRAARVIVSE